ncbi:ABC transporter permease [Patescibacteria group bacterium]|nr:ABC transporter permease [Patescibacteria group bacterium]
MVNKSDKNNQVTPTFKGGTDAKNWLITIGRNWSLIFLAGELILFSLIGTNFFTLRNFQNILIAAITILLLATGETFVIITGGIDLSVGFVMGLSCVICAKIMVALQAAGAPQAVCILTGIIVALLVGLIPGLVNGFLVAKLKVPSFIATFGIYGIAYGFAEIICRSVPVSRLPSAVGFIGHGYLAYLIPGKILTFFRQPENLSRLESRSLIGIVPNVFIIALVFIIIFGFVLTKTKFGQHTYAIGGNIDSAERAGINVGRHLLKIYMI